MECHQDRTVHRECCRPSVHRRCKTLPKTPSWQQQASGSFLKHSWIFKQNLKKGRGGGGWTQTKRDSGVVTNTKTTSIREMREEDREFKASLDYTGSLRPVRVTE